MYVFGEINKSSTTIETSLVNFTQNFTTSSDGIQSIKITSGSTNNNYWQSLNVLFYTSGSPLYQNENKFEKPTSNLSYNNRRGTQFLTKYHQNSGSVLFPIPQQYYGEKIKEGSFQFTDLNNSDNDGNNPIIKDDGFGNLYSTNAHNSQSVSSISSSDNYVGNIFYEKGIALITEDSFWSGSVGYRDLGTNYTIKLDSTNTITTYEYNVDIVPNEFNNSTNYTLRAPLSGSKPSHLTLATRHLAREFTGSFQPYITTINLYQNGNHQEPVIQAKLPKPIRKSNKINTRFKIKLDI
tara:strand:- start:20 stop:904 length:885 start_codon:yes stop_codon:yes gene_type:complete